MVGKFVDDTEVGAIAGGEESYLRLQLDLDALRQ